MCIDILDNHVKTSQSGPGVQVSAATILKSLGKNIDKEILDEIEVAAGKYNIEDGSLRILSRSWYANQTYYCTLEG